LPLLWIEFGLTGWAQALCPALNALLQWVVRRDDVATSGQPTSV
jgi:hypothetical protein